MSQKHGIFDGPVRFAALIRRSCQRRTGRTWKAIEKYPETSALFQSNCIRNETRGGRYTASSRFCAGAPLRKIRHTMRKNFTRNRAEIA